MLKAFFATVALSLPLWLPAAPVKSLAADTGRCSQNKLTTLPLVVSDQVVLVAVTLQNRDVWMVLDLAASQTTIAQSAITELQLPTEPLPTKDPLFYFGRTPATRMATIPQLMLGSVRFKKQRFVVNPEYNTAAASDGRPILGALGMDALWPYDFELDLASRKLTLYGQAHCAPGQVVYWASHFVRLPMDLGDLGTIHLTAELEGRKIEATLSTVSRITTLTRDAAHQLFGLDERSLDTEVERDVTSGALTVKDVKIRLVPSGKGCRLADGPD